METVGRSIPWGVGGGKRRVKHTLGCVAGADVNLKNKQGATALSYATMR